MGRKQTGARKQIYFYIAILLISLVAGCHSASVNKRKDLQKVDHKEMLQQRDGAHEAFAHLSNGKKCFRDGEFGGAVREFEKACSPAAKSPVAGEALLYLGFIHTDPANPRKDHGKAIMYFRKLSEGYPRSALTEQARIMLAIMKEDDESNRTIEKLKAIIEASKKVDREIEEKRRERTGGGK